MSLGIAPCKVIWRGLRVNQPLTRSGLIHSTRSLHQVHIAVNRWRLMDSGL